MKFTGNPRGVQIVILLLVLLTGWVSCKSAKADESAMFFASVGVALHSTDSYSHGLRIGLEQGPWQASLVTMGDGVVEHDGLRYVIEPNIAGCGTWHRGFKRLSIGWGACLWEHGDWSVGDGGPITEVISSGSTLHLDDDGIQLTAAIVLRRTFGENEHAYVELFHASSGGSTHYNRGRNLIGAGFRF